jgi:hypothetical protein
LTMAVLTIDEIDRELASRAKEVASMSATLVELDNHAGLAHLRRYSPTGVTAQRWTVIEKSLAQLWDDLGRMTSILESAQTLRARRSRPDDDDRGELTRLLRERALEVSRERIPLSHRRIGGPNEAIECVGLADTAERMHSAYPAVIEFLDAVDGINSLIAERLAPSQQRLEEAGVGHPTEMAELLTVSATDPLSLTQDDVKERISTIAELAALQANWPNAVASAASETARSRGQRARPASGNGRPDPAAHRLRTGPARGTSLDHNTESRGIAVAATPDRIGAASCAGRRGSRPGPA